MPSEPGNANGRNGQRRISGRITVTGTDTGLPHLTIEALNVRNGETSRLGSVMTDATGAFRLALPNDSDSGPATGNQSQLNLQLVVLGPEVNGTGREQRTVFRSDLRENAGEQEFFAISVDEESLKTAGVRPPTTKRGGVDGALAGMTRRRSDLVRVREASNKNTSVRLKTATDRRKLFREARSRIAAELTNVTAQERASGRFVPSEREIRPVQIAATKADVAALTAGDDTQRRRDGGRLLLTADQAAGVLGDTTQEVRLTEDQIEERLGVKLDIPVVLHHTAPWAEVCRERTAAERCLADTSPDGPTDDPATPTDVPGPNVAFEKGAAIARLMQRQASPEEPTEFGAGSASLEQPLTASRVREVIKGVTFAPGPADVPSFHDFHDLQIAFEPIWQEALDDKFLDDVHSAFDLFVERGGAPAFQRVAGVLLPETPEPSVESKLDQLLDIFRDVAQADSQVPPEVATSVYISLEEWLALPEELREQLRVLGETISGLRDELLEALSDVEFELSEEVLRSLRGFLGGALDTTKALSLRARIQILTAEADRLVAHARRLILERESKEVFRPTHSLIDELRRAGKAGYPFRLFAASRQHRSVNFGTIATYRQKWTPISYQAGELVSTIALGPKEIRKFTRKTVRKSRRVQKEIESNLHSRRGESDETTRSEADIIARANSKTNFSLAHEGTIRMGGELDPIGGSADTKSSFSRDAERHSEQVKKYFREAVLKSAEEYRSERKIEIETESVTEEEVTESGEIQNPNDEIPVTFLFYELQRRFRVSEKLHRVEAVVLVAQEVPKSSEIDRAWVVRHDWILNRVLLDDSFRPALAWMSTSVVSAEVALREMRDSLFRQRKLVEELREEVADRRSLMGLRYAALERQVERTARSADSGGILGPFGDLIGSIPITGDILQSGLDLITGGGEGSGEAAQLREAASKDAYDRERQEHQELWSRLQNATSLLEAVQKEYTQKLAEHLSQVAQCERLFEHIRQNILYYMQAIWAHEPDDQRFLRLRNVPVPVFEKRKSGRTWWIQPDTRRQPVETVRPTWRPLRVKADFSVLPLPDADQIPTKPLSEVADLNRPLGFKGNYLIFPMTDSNPVTEFMMQPYVTIAEGEYGLSDPDPLGNMTLDEFSEFVCCLKEKLRSEASENPPEPGTPDEFEALKPMLREALQQLLQRSRRNEDEIIVPSNCLYIEALPGAHSVMEKFKHLHRQIDVKRAQSELRESELDNVRRAQRILEAELEDPDIEAKYVFEGDGSATVVAPSNGIPR